MVGSKSKSLWSLAAVVGAAALLAQACGPAQEPEPSLAFYQARPSGAVTPALSQTPEFQMGVSSILVLSEDGKWGMFYAGRHLASGAWKVSSEGGKRSVLLSSKEPLRAMSTNWRIRSDDQGTWLESPGSLWRYLLFDPSRLDGSTASSSTKPHDTFKTKGP